MLFELDLIAQRNPVGARHGDLRLQVDTAAINGTAMHSDKAKAAPLVKTQRVNVVVGGNDPQTGASLLRRQLLDRLDHGRPRPVPLLGSVQGQDLALLPVRPGHIREHPQQAPARGLRDKRRMAEGMQDFPEAGHPGTAVPGEKRLGRRLVSGFPRTDLHRINVTVAGLAQAHTAGIRDKRDWRLAPAEEGHHIQRDDADGTVVADGYVLDARPFGGRYR